MPEYSGAPPSVELTRALWLLPIVPLVAAAVCALWRSKEARPGMVALAGTGAPLALLIWKWAELFSAPAARRTLIETPWTLLRIGSLDLGFGLALDPVAAVVGTAAAIAAFAATLELGRRGGASRRELGVICLALGALLLTVLADNLLLFAMGWQGLGLAGYLLAGDRLELRDERSVWSSVAIGGASQLALLGGSLMLLWGLGGIWTSDGQFVPDFHARLVSVSSGGKATATRIGEETRSGRGTLTITALPGSTVKLGGAELCARDDRDTTGGLGTLTRPCRERAQTPFVSMAVPAAIHDVLISPGPGANDQRVEKVRVGRGIESQIVITGPTLVFREIAEQLTIRDVSGVAALRAHLTKKKLWGIPLLALVAVLFVAAAGLRALRAWEASTASGIGAALCSGFGIGSAALLIVRTAPVLSFAPRASSVLAALAALAALWLALRAMHQQRLASLVALAVASQTALAIAGAMLGGGPAAGVHVAVQLLSAMALLLAASAKSRAFVFGAAAAAAAPIPALGAFWTRDELLWHAFATSESVWIPGWVTFVLGLVASAIVAFALWRMHYAAAKKDPTQDARTAVVVGAAALLIGLAMVPFGDPSKTAPGQWLFGKSATDTPIDPSLRYGLLVIVFALPLAAWAASRRRFADKLPGAALFGRELAPLVALGLTSGLERAAGVVLAVDRRIERVFGAPEPSEPPAPAPAEDLAATVPEVPKPKKGRAS